MYALLFAFCFAAELITKPVGQIGDTGNPNRSIPPHFVSIREVQLHRVIVRSDQNRTPQNLPATSSEFAPELVEALKHWVVYLETEAFGISEMSDEEREQLSQRVSEAVAKSDFYRGLEFSSKEIQENTLRYLKARNFIAFKKRSVPQASDAEVLHFFNENKVRFGDGKFEDYKDNIRVALNLQLSEQRLGEWYRVLLRKYGARSFLQDL